MDSNCYCICYLSNGDILTGHYNGNIKEWKLINNELKFIGEKKVHEKLITVIYEIKNNFLLSGSQDKKIMFIKLNIFKLIYLYNLNQNKKSPSIVYKIH